ncbi:MULTISPECIES: phage holin family protein [Niastella]|uniref:Phage holin family protein n=1 Tax=Niastella soli TaxID=2821487 RepID=A0ABS3YYT7_9BACT|nr:phage holin family protein [Niastella soli]MBO9203090.1 phage holin family protein [Niastella soli]
MEEDPKTKVQEIKEETKDLLESVTDYLNTYYHLISVTVAQKGINIASGAVNAVILIIFGFFSFGFISLGLGWWLGNLVNNRIVGFFLVAGFYIMIMIFIIIMRKNLILPFLRNLLTKKVYE